MKVGLFFCFLLMVHPLFAKEVYVSADGNDANSGSQHQPFASLEKAISATKSLMGKEPVQIWVGEGTYYLSETLVLDESCSGTAESPVQISAVPGAQVFVKGSTLLSDLNWSEFNNGIWVADVDPELQADQLFVNGKRQIRARFPNYDYQNPLRGGKGYQRVTGGTNKRYDEWFSYNPETFSTKNWKTRKQELCMLFRAITGEICSMP